MAEETIRVNGIPDLQKALRQIDKDLPRELAGGLAEASEIVLRAAIPLVPVDTGAAVASMKVKRQQRGASIGVGGTKAPYFPWLDFGGAVGRGKAIERPFLKAGRYIYPTLKAKQHDVKAKVDEVLERMARRAGFETTGDGAR